MKPTIGSEPELSRPLRVDKISAGGMAEDIVANAQERKKLTARFGLLDISKLEASLNIDPERGRMLAVTGTFNADVVQECVVTLEPLPSHISGSIDVLFAPPAMLDKGAGPPHFDSGEEDVPEPIVNGVIDLGELVAQHLAVALDPYPRKQGVGLPSGELKVESAAPKPVNPFATLVEFKKKPTK